MKFKKTSIIKTTSEIKVRNAPRDSHFLVYAGTVERQTGKTPKKVYWDDTGHLCGRYKRLYVVYGDGEEIGCYVRKSDAVKEAKSYLR